MKDVKVWQEEFELDLTPDNSTHDLFVSGVCRLEYQKRRVSLQIELAGDLLDEQATIQQVSNFLRQYGLASHVAVNLSKTIEDSHGRASI